MQRNFFQFILFSLFTFASLFSQDAAAAVCSFNGDTIISVTCEGGTISDANSSITINSGATLDVSGSRLTVDANIDITSIINNGTIKGGAMHSGAFKAYRNNNIGTFINNGSVNFNGFKGFWITNDPTDSGNHGIFTNNGTWSSNGSRAFYNDSGTSWTSFTNSGSFTANGDRSFYLDGSGSIGTLTNSGTLTTDGTNATGINSFYLGSDYTITNFINSGTWALGTSGASLNGTITTLTNTGTITGTLKNSGTITTFNNGGVVAYESIMPVNYNIIINNISDFGKLNVTSGSGSTTFGIHSSSSVSNDTLYKNIATGLSASDILNTSGTYQGFSWKLRNTSGTSWDLIFGNPPPSSTSTMTSIQSISYGIASIFSSFGMTTNYANMNYDCDWFDQDGSCFSIGGRYNDVNSNNSDTYSSALIAIRGFKINDNFRITGFVDQQANINEPNGINVDNKGPLLGISLVWNQRADLLGYQFKVGNAYQLKDIAITRSAIDDATGNAIAGRGNTKIKVKSHFAEVSHQFIDGIKTSYRLYFAMRRTTIEQNGYTETGVNYPLTFNALEDKSTTVILGMNTKYKLNSKITFNGALRVEHDVSNKVDTIQATSSTIAGLTPVELNSNENKIRPVLALGVTFHISPKQSFSVKTEYQELTHTSTNVNTAYFHYNISF
tara:strand:- start:352 stop:2358 length:2007 start_codon:yes stop_codon:yes gene_type:complete